VRFRFHCALGHDTYCVGNGAKAVIISTDIFGWRFPNARAIADQYAAAGYSVFIPATIADSDVADPNV
jgi:dienelactone hydrolase